MRLLIGLFATAFVLLCAAMIALFLGRPSSEAAGLWRTNGYGMYVDIGAVQTQIYEVTDTACQAADVFPSHRGLLRWAEGISFDAVDGRLVVNADGIYHPITAERVSKLPETCNQLQPSDPPAVVEAVYQHFNEHYPFFDLHAVDWEANTNRARALVGPDTSDDELLDILRVQLDGVRDGHVYVYTGETGFSPHPGAPWKEHYAMANAVAQDLTPVTCIPDSALCYGTLPGNVGWIRLLGMDADDARGQATAKAHAHMQTAAKALAQTKAILIDNRFNPGGSDDVSLAYAASFTKGGFEAFHKLIVTQDGLSEPIPAFVPDLPGTKLSQPVFLLNSRYTASAAEIFSIAMRELPQVTILGDPSGGELSDILNRQLPNGWQLGLSHQIYRSNADEEFEGLGIPVDEPAPFDLDGFLAGQDTVVQDLLTRLR
ncbi:S41 family peptidase [Shimia ponticola]|uniref:S41 family peptidase n=1 Tax=Shimia ponticola TaxID=2582893 RepID=UPI0011BFCCF9|nr:S41 family peptidase [Shimia ponticola]